jgi:hypothetical protein
VAIFERVASNGIELILALHRANSLVVDYDPIATKLPTQMPIPIAGNSPGFTPVPKAVELALKLIEAERKRRRETSGPFFDLPSHFVRTLPEPFVRMCSNG